MRKWWLISVLLVLGLLLVNIVNLLISHPNPPPSKTAPDIVGLETRAEAAPVEVPTVVAEKKPEVLKNKAPRRTEQNVEAVQTPPLDTSIPKNLPVNSEDEETMNAKKKATEQKFSLQKFRPGPDDRFDCRRRICPDTKPQNVQVVGVSLATDQKDTLDMPVVHTRGRLQKGNGQDKPLVHFE